MAILRDPVAYDNTVNYIATLALFCGISCTILMLRFGGFKATFNLSSANRIKSEYYEDVPVISDTNGAYRTNREEFFGNGSISDPPKRIDPSMVKLPQTVGRPGPDLKPSKSTGNLTQPSTTHPNSNNSASNSTQTSNLHPNKSASNSTQPSNLRPDISKSTPNVSMNPQGETANNRDTPNVKNANSKDAKKQLDQQKKLEKKQLDEQKKLEKKRLDEQKKLEKKELDEQKKLQKKQLDEQKKRDKLVAQERAKLEKERKTKEKQEAQLQAKQAKANNDKNKGKSNAPRLKAPTAQGSIEAPTVKTRANPLGQGTSQAIMPPPPPPPPQPTQAPTHTAKQARKQAPTQAPTPRQYSTNTLESSISRTSGPPAYTEAADVVQNQKDNTGNTSFGKPIDSSSSWDMIAQHRQEMSRPAVTGGGARKQTVLDLEYTVQTDA